MCVIGTPGFGSSDDVAAHVAAQKHALDGIALSGVYAVVKFEPRTDAIVKLAEILMEFLGSDDIRVNVTHADTAGDDGFDANVYKSDIARKLDLKVHHVILVGKHSSGDEIATFVANTLHAPKQFKITATQIAAVASLSGIRKYNKPINHVLAKLKVATETCHQLVKQGKTYESDLAIVATQNLARTMVAEGKESIFREAYENLAMESDQNLVYGKAGVSLHQDHEQMLNLGCHRSSRPAEPLQEVSVLRCRLR